MRDHLGTPSPREPGIVLSRFETLDGQNRYGLSQKKHHQRDRTQERRKEKASPRRLEVAIGLAEAYYGREALRSQDRAQTRGTIFFSGSGSRSKQVSKEVSREEKRRVARIPEAPRAFSPSEDNFMSQSFCIQPVHKYDPVEPPSLGGAKDFSALELGAHAPLQSGQGTLSPNFPTVGTQSRGKSRAAKLKKGAHSNAAATHLKVDGGTFTKQGQAEGGADPPSYLGQEPQQYLQHIKHLMDTHRIEEVRMME